MSSGNLHVVSLFKELIKQREDDLNMSTWLTVLEISRQSEYLAEFEKYVKSKFQESYDQDLFNTTEAGNGSTDVGNESFGPNKYSRKNLRSQRPKSVLIGSKKAENSTD